MNPLVRAEQAVLGAILLDPSQLDPLSPWLSADHFYRPAHQAIYAAMLKLRADDHPALRATDEVPLAWLTDIFDEAARHTRGLTPSYAHTLVAACPRAGNAPVYGRMVLEGAIHRSVLQHATRLHQAARADALQGDVENTVHHVQVLSDVLADLARRWGTEPRPLSSPGETTPVTPALGQTDEHADDERLLLGLLADRPDGMDKVIGWLRPGDFADPAHGELYRCLGALHHRGEPIDVLTLQWEAQRRGLLADGTLTADQVSAICDSAGTGSADFLGELVISSALVRTASASARAIQDLAHDESLAPGRLIGRALHALAPVAAVQDRWHTAIGTSPPYAPTPAPAPQPPTARVQAALARSHPEQHSAPPPPRTAGRAHAAAHTPARSHP